MYIYIYVYMIMLIFGSIFHNNFLNDRIHAKILLAVSCIIYYSFQRYFWRCSALKLNRDSLIVQSQAKFWRYVSLQKNSMKPHITQPSGNETDQINPNVRNEK
jgi:hypothetical protein